jgi:protein-S-isoprenylcysteine O-methyltransferase Ste14
MRGIRNNTVKEKLTKSGVRAFLAPLRWIIVTGLVFFLASGEIHILRAWIYIGIYAIAGIDRRLNLIEILPFFCLYIGIILYILSTIFSIWPMLHNPFFEGTVRIQKEKNHLALGSVLALIPLFMMIVLIFIRTYYEDTILKKELTGYSEYCKEVQYRLIPFVW